MAREMEEVRDACQNSIECWLARTDRSVHQNHACGAALDCCFVDQRVCRGVNLGGEVGGHRPKAALDFVSLPGLGPVRRAIATTSISSQ